MRNKQREPRIITGTFGGKIKDFVDTKDENGNILQTWQQERAFEQKHLKAYLGGHEFFRHGFSREEGEKQSSPRWFMVKRINPEKTTILGA